MKKAISLFLMFILLVSCSAYTNLEEPKSSSSNPSNTSSTSEESSVTIENPHFPNISKEMMIEDYKEMIEVLDNNYPYYNLAKRK